MIVEAFGTSGVGKSETLDLAQSRRGASRTWLGPDESLALIGRPPDTARLREAVDDPALRELLSGCISILSESSMLPSQIITALTILRNSCHHASALRAIAGPTPLVHDELLLHRAFSLIPHSRRFEDDATWYFSRVPAPDAAVLFRGDPDQVVERALARPVLTNVYYGLDAAGIRSAVERSDRVGEIALEVLTTRGVDVAVIDTREPIHANAELLNSHLTGLRSHMLA